MKPHKKFDCPCTDCQVWYRARLAELSAENERLRDQITTLANEAVANVDAYRAAEARVKELEDAVKYWQSRSETLSFRMVKQ